MKKVLLFLSVIILAACNPKKTETTDGTDSLRIDSAVLATTPAPSTLAFSDIPGFSLNSKLTFKDSVNYFLLTSQEDLNAKFVTDSNSASEVINPDFIINHIVAVALSPTQQLATITMEKVEVNDKEINVYLHIKYGDRQDFVAKPSHIFAIEKRDGMIDIQFWVNGKKNQALMLM